MPFLVIFIIIPLVELFVFAAISEYIGLFTAFLLALLTAIIGGSIVKQQGLQTLQAFQKSVQAKHLPVTEIFDGFCLIAAGAMLITPGFVTDTIGFLLLVPRVREHIRAFFKGRTVFAASFMSEEQRSTNHDTGRTRTGTGYDDGIIEGECEDLSNSQSSSSSPAERLD